MMLAWMPDQKKRADMILAQSSLEQVYKCSKDGGRKILEE